MLVLTYTFRWLTTLISGCIFLFMNIHVAVFNMISTNCLIFLLYSIVLCTIYCKWYLVCSVKYTDNLLPFVQKYSMRLRQVALPWNWMFCDSDCYMLVSLPMYDWTVGCLKQLLCNCYRNPRRFWGYFCHSVFIWCLFMCWALDQNSVLVYLRSNDICQ